MYCWMHDEWVLNMNKVRRKNHINRARDDGGFWEGWETDKWDEEADWDTYIFFR